MIGISLAVAAWVISVVCLALASIGLYKNRKALAYVLVAVAVVIGLLGVVALIRG